MTMSRKEIQDKNIQTVSLVIGIYMISLLVMFIVFATLGSVGVFS